MIRNWCLVMFYILFLCLVGVVNCGVVYFVDIMDWEKLCLRKGGEDLLVLVLMVEMLYGFVEIGC